MSRNSGILGIRHRRKQTSEGEARPTQVAIKTVFGAVLEYNLESDTDELDFLMGRFPVEWRNVLADEDITVFPAHQCKWRTVRKAEEVTGMNPAHLRKVLNKQGMPITELCTKVPIKFDGLIAGDKVGMVLGGSGDRFAAALSKRGEQIDATVFRVPPFSLAMIRDTKDKDDDPKTLVNMLENSFHLFYQVRQRDRELISVKEALSARMDAMKARIACEQRIQQSLVGKIFLNPEGHFPEGVIEAQFDDAKVNDKILQALISEEKRRDKELAQAVECVEIWEQIFKPIKGVGPRLAAGIIAPIGDIRRFMVQPDFSACLTPEDRQKARNKAIQKTGAKLKRFCGVHVTKDGKFPRRRKGELANWNPNARQALYLLADQFNRSPDSTWGQKLRENKARLRATHPTPVEVEVVGENGKGKKTVKRYTDGHIHKMATWRTLSRFVEWFSREWLKIENNNSSEQSEEKAA